MMSNPYRGKRWTRKRDAILRRDDYECRNCRRYGKHTLATTVHHVYFLKDYPKMWLVNDNLISLCNDCHNKMHNRTNDEATELAIYWQNKQSPHLKKYF